MSEAQEPRRSVNVYGTAQTTRLISARDLRESMVLVGASGGLSAVYGAQPSSLRRGVMRIVTEHGYLYAEKDDEMEILDES
tara:strand:+ start:227 stop:469 length:243 start_codon:yes stop_codon:yes gene_type:complete